MGACAVKKCLANDRRFAIVKMQEVNIALCKVKVSSALSTI